MYRIGQFTFKYCFKLQKRTSNNAIYLNNLLTKFAQRRREMCPSTFPKPWV